MNPEVMVQIGGSNWSEKLLIPIFTTFLGAGAGAYFAMLTSTKLKRREEENKHCEAAQWVLVCLFNQWHYLSRLKELFEEAGAELKDVPAKDRYLFIRQISLDHYRLLDMQLENLSHFALHGEPGLLIEMVTCQEMVTDVLTHMRARDQKKAEIDSVVQSSEMNRIEFTPELGRVEWTRMAINNQKLDEELASYTGRVFTIIGAGIDKHVQVINLFRKELKKLHPGVKFVGFRPPDGLE